MKKSNQPKYSLGIDTETSGFSLPEYAKNHYLLSIALVLVDNSSLEIIDSLYLEQKFDKNYKWSNEAEKIHGLSQEYLEENGLSSLEVAEQVANFIFANFATTDVMILGHNPNFDIAFLRQLLEPHGLMPTIYHRVIDSSIAGFVNLGTHLSDEIFDKLGFTPRKEHNCLEDIIYTVESLKIMREKFKTIL